ncbi:SO_0444 family Cu/Zn efflux transporter [Salinimonas marina]|uniref:SO_0444 family Cu/Zn efflux transporter n=1 Tax=Salinimonas marina TaxID=2785918 RepID=A0A7S9DX15_9ALTE|nr:SO_0444 family Cu/Zn efflux transporter [Salinimonas marina]QPG05518.1 SO_0444 family Cu/Zn efflux transporter [Salinimonas marina]
MNDILLLTENFLALFMESAPWLLLGLAVAAVMHELVPVSLLQRHMGSSSVSAISKAAVIGAPLPLCSCGVIPAAVGLRRSGASKPATVSFLVSTPETGVDSVSVSYALLGPLFAIVRPVAAIISALYAGIMVKLFVQEDKAAVATSQTATAAASASSCCSTETAPSTSSGCSSGPSEPAPARVEESCCASKATVKKSAEPGKMTAMWRFATGQLLEDIAVWLLVGLALAAAIQTWVPTDFLTQWGDGLVAMMVMAFIGIPMYICATASTPIAVGFLAAGLSPGAVLVFLLAGPATNVSTMGMILKELGRRSLVLYIFSVTSAAISLGYLLNWAVAAFNWQGLIVTAGDTALHGGTTEVIYALCAMILGRLSFVLAGKS